MTSIWTKLSLWQSERFHEYQYTSPPVYLHISIPVYLYTSHTKASVYQSTCIPVTQKSSIPVHLYTSHENTSIPFCQYTSRCRHHATTTWCQRPTSRRP